MNRMTRVAVVVAVAVFAAGCGDTGGDSPAGTFSDTAVTGSDTPSGTESGSTADTGDSGPVSTGDVGVPGVPGSPIDYDSNLRGAAPDVARSSILQKVRELCAGGCGIKVVIRGKGECSPEIGPDPVARGGTITIVAGPCPGDPPPDSSTSDSPADASTSDSPAETG